MWGEILKFCYFIRNLTFLTYTIPILRCTDFEISASKFLKYNFRFVMVLVFGFLIFGQNEPQKFLKCDFRVSYKKRVNV